MPKQSVDTALPIEFSEVVEVVYQSTVGTNGKSLTGCFSQAITQGGTFNNGPGRDSLLDFVGYSVAPPVSFNPFDHMVIRFNYTKPTNGSDLDIMIYYIGTGTIYDSDAVGYGQTPNQIKIPNNSTSDSSAYLWWALDDNNLPNGPCVEAVVIGINKFNIDNTVSGNYIDIVLRAGWFSSNSGNNLVSITLETYLGGTMSKSGTNIINTGGTLVNSEVKNVTVTSGLGQVTLIQSDLVGTVRYNKTNKTAVLL